MSNIIRFFFIISNSMFVTEPISGAVLMLWGIWGLVLVLGALLLLSYCYGANNPKLNNNPFFIITISFFQLLLQIVSVKLEKLEVSKTKACQSTSKCAIFQKNWNSVAICDISPKKGKLFWTNRVSFSPKSVKCLSFCSPNTDFQKTKTTTNRPVWKFRRVQHLHLGPFCLRLPAPGRACSFLLKGSTDFL